MQHFHKYAKGVSILVLIATSGCKTDGTFIVPASDPTPPSAIWIQADRPNQPLLNAYANSADPPGHAAPGQAIAVTARADDPDGGIKDVQIWKTVEKWKADGTHESPGLAGAPEASNSSNANVGDPAQTTMTVQYTLMPDPESGGSHSEYVLWAVGRNFHGGTVQTQWLKIEVP